MMTVFLMSSAFLYAAGNTKSSWDSSDGVSLYGGTGISVGALPTTVSSDILDALSNLVVIVSTLRATAYGQLCFDVTDSLSIGASAGVYAITWVSDTGKVTVLDVPVHFLARLDADALGIEGFGGYYFSALNTSSFSFNGIELGAKVYFDDIYISWSEVLASTAYQRFEIGYELR